MLIGMRAQYDPTGHTDTAFAMHEQRWILLLSFIAKTYVATALAANIQYSGSFSDRK